MSLRIIQPTESIIVRHPIFMIFGQPGTGKTSLGFSAENPVLLNFDAEEAITRALFRGPTMNVLSCDDLCQLEEGTGLVDPYTTIVVDPVGSCVNLMATDIIHKDYKMGQGGSLNQRGWGVLKNRFAAWMQRLRELDKNILLLAHHKEEKGTNDSNYVRPDISGGSKDEVMRLSSFVGYLHFKGTKRVLDFSPTEEWFGKNPANWDQIALPEPERARSVMTKLMAQGAAYLSKESERSSNLANSVQDWKAKIETLTTFEDFNQAVPEVLGLKMPSGSIADIGHTLIGRATALGFIYNQEKKAFSAPVPKQETLVGL